MSTKNYFTFLFLLCLFILFSPVSAYSQNKLQTEFKDIAQSVNGNLGVSASLIETGESISINGDKKFPMQSVYKFPIAMIILKKIDDKKFSLGDIIHIDKLDYIPKEGHSPIRDKFPNGVDLSLKNIIRYNIEESDGTACDVLLRLLGGTESTEAEIHNLGIRDISIATTEMVQAENDTVQYQNWATPIAMNNLLKIFIDSNYLTANSKELLLKYMSKSGTWFNTRIKGLLPPNTKVIHKTGSSRTIGGLTRATNDVGIIILPNGKHLAISIFLSDSHNSQEDREKTIAKISKAAFDYWTKDK